MSRSHLEKQKVLLLQAVISPGEEAIRAWDTWHTQIDWDDDLDKGTVRLLPQLHRNLKAHGVNHPLMPKFAGISRKNWVRTQRVLQQIMPAISTLNEAGIPVMVPHPLALVILDSEYALDHQKPFVLIVRQRELTGALLQLQRMGWFSEVRLPRMWIAGFATERQELLLQHESAGYLILAWDFEDETTCLDITAVWARAQPTQILNTPLFIPDVVDYLTLLCADYGECPGNNLFSLMIEIILVLMANKTAVDWQQLTKTVERRPLSEAAYDAFSELHTLLPDLVPVVFKKALKPVTSQPASAPLTTARNRPINQIHHAWLRYRRRLGSQTSLSSAIVAFPGYLMAKWVLPSPGELPPKVWRSIKHHGSKAIRRPAKNSGS